MDILDLLEERKKQINEVVEKYILSFDYVSRMPKIVTIIIKNKIGDKRITPRELLNILTLRDKINIYHAIKNDKYKTFNNLHKLGDKKCLLD